MYKTPDTIIYIQNLTIRRDNFTERVHYENRTSDTIGYDID